MKGTPQRKGLASGHKLACYAAGGMVGRPQKRYVFENGQGPKAPPPPKKTGGCGK